MAIRWQVILLIPLFCIPWLLVTIIHGDWLSAAMNLGFFAYLLSLLGTLMTVPLLIMTLYLSFSTLVRLLRKPSWGDTVLLSIIGLTMLIVLNIPTRAAWIYHQERTEIETIRIKSDKSASTVHRLEDYPRMRRLLRQVPVIRGGWKRTGCITFRIGELGGLVYSETGEMPECSYAWAWARRINKHWFETSDSFTLWFTQPRRALIAFVEAFAAGLGCVGGNC